MQKIKQLSINNGREALKFLQKEFEKRNFDKVFWTTSSGAKIDIAKMTDNHLKNTIQMLEKRIRIRDFYNQLREEL